ncbi:MAG: hypothetical protein SGJ20_11415 [Planctomycetota bacterium]|nr:hypothetical protein [Planctomycetota bacterium]
MIEEIVSEEDIRAVLQPQRVDPGTFAAGVRERLSAQPEVKIASLSPALQYAAAILPAGIISQKQLAEIAGGAAPAKGSKLLAVLVYPAVCFFLLIGATLVSVFKIRGIQAQNLPDSTDGKQLVVRMKRWQNSQGWKMAALFVITVATMWYGATWLLFLGFIASFSVLIYVLRSLAKAGIGNRLVVGQSCFIGLIPLMSLGQIMAMRSQGIHFVEQSVLAAIVFAGVTILSGLMVGIMPPGHYCRGTNPGRAAFILQVIICVGLSIWSLRPVIWPVTPQQMKDYVESFDHTSRGSVNAEYWEIVAEWTVESGLHPDFAKPEQLLAAEIAKDQPNPILLATGLRLGLLSAAQASTVYNYEGNLRFLRQQVELDRPFHVSLLIFYDWVIRTAVARGDLSGPQLDKLPNVLQRMLETADTAPDATLATVLQATRLLKVVGKPVDPIQYRRQVHDLLRRFHRTGNGGFCYGPRESVGSARPTAYAIELMQIYGVPEGLDLNWVRSFLKPTWTLRPPEKYVLAVTLDRFNKLPGVAPPTWREILYYERTLLAAIVLIGLCIYATLLSPKPRYVE